MCVLLVPFGRASEVPGAASMSIDYSDADIFLRFASFKFPPSRKLPRPMQVWAVGAFRMLHIDVIHWTWNARYFEFPGNAVRVKI